MVGTSNRARAADGGRAAAGGAWHDALADRRPAPEVHEAAERHHGAVHVLARGEAPDADRDHCLRGGERQPCTSQAPEAATLWTHRRDAGRSLPSSSASSTTSRPTPATTSRSACSRMLRNEFYDRMEPLAPAGTAELRTGDAVSRVINDCERVEPFYAHTIAPAICALVVPAILLWLPRAFPAPRVCLDAGSVPVRDDLRAAARHDAPRAAKAARSGARSRAR